MRSALRFQNVMAPAYEKATGIKIEYQIQAVRSTSKGLKASFPVSFGTNGTPPLPEFLPRLRELDAGWKRRVETARAQGTVLRYLATANTGCEQEPSLGP